MFREAIMHPSNDAEDEDAMCPEAFSNVCFEHGMQNFVEYDDQGNYKLRDIIEFDPAYDDSPIDADDDLDEEGWSDFDELEEEDLAGTATLNNSPSTLLAKAAEESAK